MQKISHQVWLGVYKFQSNVQCRVWLCGMITNRSHWCGDEDVVAVPVNEKNYSYTAPWLLFSKSWDLDWTVFLLSGWGEVKAIPRLTDMKCDDTRPVSCLNRNSSWQTYYGESSTHHWGARETSSSDKISCSRVMNGCSAQPLSLPDTGALTEVTVMRYGFRCRCSSQLSFWPPGPISRDQGLALQCRQCWRL